MTGLVVGGLAAVCLLVVLTDNPPLRAEFDHPLPIILVTGLAAWAGSRIWPNLAQIIEKWPAAMGIVVLEGVVITLLVVTGLREWIMDAIPLALKQSISVGR